jgi:O-antigen/teichoic acid export membrane protein
VKAFSRYVSDVRPAAVSPVSNHGAPQRIASTVALKTTADVVSKSVTLVITVVAARVLSTSEFGVLALAMTTGWLMSVASDAGLSLFLAKEAAQSVERPLPFTSVLRVIGVRTLLAAFAFAVGSGVGLMVAPREALAAFALIVLAQLAAAVMDTVAHAYRGIGRADIESGLTLVIRLTTGTVAVLLLLLRPSLLGLSFALALLSFASVLISLGIAAFTFPRGPAAPLDLSARRFVMEIGPIGAGILVSALYFRCDVYFVEWWHGLETVGVYNAAFRIVEALRLFPAAVLAVVFPVLCRARDVVPVRQLGTWLLVGGGVLMALLLASAPALLDLLYGEQAYLLVTLMALAVNLVGNATLIPSLGMVGAALSTMVTEIAVSAGCVMALWRLQRREAGPTNSLADLSGNSVGAR